MKYLILCFICDIFWILREPKSWLVNGSKEGSILFLVKIFILEINLSHSESILLSCLSVRNYGECSFSTTTSQMKTHTFSKFSSTFLGYLSERGSLFNVCVKSFFSMFCAYLLCKLYIGWLTNLLLLHIIAFKQLHKLDSGLAIL